MTNYGFVIDNRKCIGCHACTVACKAEHDVAVGVNRTWVKYIEKGTYPNTRRLFSVMRCNHCENAPCVEICPVTALFTRSDGIIDFDGSRCIACKSCMQACPYDALYIDPKTQTAAKCNYCTNRVEVGLQPACVVVCPEEAIISGDLDNPHSKISQLISLETVSVRKEEKGTVPNVFYIDGDQLMLTPNQTIQQDNYMWSAQAAGVGHYAGHNFQNTKSTSGNGLNATRVYDAPDKGRLWGWQVPSYLVTKSISAGVAMLFALLMILDHRIEKNMLYAGFILSIVAIGLTALFLVMDLDQPKRFHTILLRPNMSSWLARGAFIITGFGGLLSLFLLQVYISDSFRANPLLVVLLLGFAIMTAIYTAFLFAQAKARDYWQSPLLPFEMFVHSLLTGSASLLFLDFTMLSFDDKTNEFLWNIYIVAVVGTILFAIVEATIKHPTKDAQTTAKMLKSGKYAKSYWSGLLLAGVLPLQVLIGLDFLLPFIFVFSIIGIFLVNRAWVYAPQDISLV